MKYILFVFVLFFSKFIFSQCGNRYQNVIYSNVITTTYTYGQNTRYDSTTQVLKMDVYTPQGDNVTNRPLVIFCFGGAFVTGTRTSTELVYFANYLAQRGFVCASIDYRLDNSGNMSTNGESGAVIRAVQDAKAAVRFAKSKSSEWGIDTNFIFIGGTSAGGVTALTTGYSQYEEFNATIQAKINELGGWEGTTNNLSNTSKIKGLFNFAGAVLDTHHIQSQDLPVYLNHATKDATVPFYSGYPLNGQSTTFMHGSGNIAVRMKNKGNYYSIDSFQSTDHPAFITNDILTTVSLTNQTAENLRKFLYKVIGCEAMTASISAAQHLLNIPNPIGDIIHLPQPAKNLKLYNLWGKLVWSTEREIETIDVSHLPMGIYFLETETGRVKLWKEN